MNINANMKCVNSSQDTSRFETFHAAKVTLHIPSSNVSLPLTLDTCLYKTHKILNVYYTSAESQYGDHACVAM